MNAVLRSASSERESKKGQLDRAMISLDRALDPARSAKFADLTNLNYGLCMLSSG